AVLVLERIFDVAHRKPARQHLDRQILKPLRVTLEMLPNGRAKRLIPPSNLWRRIFHQPLCRPQPSRAISIPVALARLRAMLVVLASDRIGRFALQRLLDNQPGRELDQLVLRQAVESRLSINAVSSSRVCCEAGSLVAMGCSFAGLPSPLLNHTLQRMHPAKFPATLRLHPISFLGMRSSPEPASDDNATHSIVASPLRLLFANAALFGLASNSIAHLAYFAKWRAYIPI